MLLLLLLLFLLFGIPFHVLKPTNRSAYSRILQPFLLIVSLPKSIAVILMLQSS
jgi:hypothetical protein